MYSNSFCIFFSLSLSLYWKPRLSFMYIHLLKILFQYNWLVVSTHLKNISQNGNLPQVGVKIKNIWNNHLDNFKNPQIPPIMITKVGCSDFTLPLRSRLWKIGDLAIWKIWANQGMSYFLWIPCWGYDYIPQSSSDKVIGSLGNYVQHCFGNWMKTQPAFNLNLL